MEWPAYVADLNPTEKPSYLLGQRKPTANQCKEQKRKGNQCKGKQNF